MMNRLLLIILFAATLLCAQDGAYILKDGERISIGNKYIQRVISVRQDTPGTIEIGNKLSGKNYKVKSDEFKLEVIIPGLGPVFGKVQNGENLAPITAKEMKFTGYRQQDFDKGGKELVLNFTFASDLTAFALSVHYTILPNDPYMRKWIEITDSTYKSQLFERIYVESITLDKPSFSRGQFGQPVFTNDLFLGVEYPTAENQITANTVRCGYVAGDAIKKLQYTSHSSVLGVSRTAGKLEQAFMNYVEKIKVNGTRPYLLYNSWYDFRNKAIVDDSASVMNERNVLNRIETFKTYMFDKYQIPLDAFVLDDGWDKYDAVWDMDAAQLPNGLTPFVTSLKRMNTGLGIWSSPFGGYSNRDLRVKSGAEHGYETTADFYCLAGKKYSVRFKDVMVDYTKKYHLGYFKWDGFIQVCNELDHGHLPGIYSREASVATYIDLMQAVRKVNPDIYLNITTGTWLSPWWLQYADCIWMQGEDYAYAEEVPSMNDRDKSITYRDAVLWGDLQKQKLLFPMSSLMTHGIIKGRLNFLGGKDESLDSFTNEVMIYFGRGVMMWELYVSPDLLSDNEWNAIASSVKWAKANKEILQTTKMILGEPLKREPYGYLHIAGGKGILMLRNPDVAQKTIQYKLTEDFGDLNPNQDYYVKIIYPYNMILPEPVKGNGLIKIKLNGYEVMTAELVPADQLQKGLPLGVKYEIKNNQLTVFSVPNAGGAINSVKAKNAIKVSFKGPQEKLQIKETPVPVTDGKTIAAKAAISLPASYKGAKFAFLLEPDTKLQNENKPELQIEVNGVIKKLNVVEENGKWFWVLADLQNGENAVEYKITFKGKVQGKISTWILADHELVARDVKDASVKEDEILPAKPYPANVQKEIISVKKSKI